MSHVGQISHLQLWCRSECDAAFVLHAAHALEKMWHNSISTRRWNVASLLPPHSRCSSLWPPRSPPWLRYSRHPDAVNPRFDQEPCSEEREGCAASFDLHKPQWRRLPSLLWGEAGDQGRYLCTDVCSPHPHLTHAQRRAFDMKAEDGCWGAVLKEGEQPTELWEQQWPTCPDLQVRTFLFTRWSRDEDAWTRIVDVPVHFH